jgi:hypothetical protein
MQRRYLPGSSLRQGDIEDVKESLTVDHILCLLRVAAWRTVSPCRMITSLYLARN